ncbi:MAG: copper-translocating P-type ATPase [Chloroflexi bacterium]|nr:copper-translocating P-type ATPase [Chloroflexota bacterium]MCL5950067.1 copper-translocating P-type ATPase [Candidatus Bathyarchaeota archaeon]
MNHQNHGMQGMKHEAPVHSMHTETLKTRFFVCLALTIPVLLLSGAIQTWFYYSLTLPYQTYILLFLAVIIYGYGGWPFLRGLTQELRALQPGMMTLIGTAISVAFFFSAATVFFPVGNDFFWELATLIDVMLLGHWLEAKSVLGASRALEELVRVMPTTAHMVMDGAVMDMPVSELQVGYFVLVRPGEKVPSDGVVVEGESFVNEALLTGESKPVHKQAADRVIGGAVNGDGALTVKIERMGEETYLSQVVRLVRQAQESKSRTQDLANRAAALLFYVAVVVGVVTFAVWASLGNVQFALTRTVTVLVIACPHALGLAIPLVVAISTAITAKKGILIRDRKAFEEAKGVNAVVFDKTGTLTMGQFGVSNIVSFISEDELLSLTSAVERNSEHIIAKAIVKYAEAKGTAISKSQSFEAVPGKGAKAKVNGKEVYVGSPSLLKELNIQPTDEKVLELQKAGKTVVFTVVDGELAGVFALADRVREESRRAVLDLKARGVKVYMLTGDSEEVAKDVAEELGIVDYFAEVLPDQKAEKIKMIKAQDYMVAMVGDGINDAPALVTADLGIAIGAGTDVAIESADVILVKNDPRDVPMIIDFSKRTYSKMVQNLWWAAGYNVFAIPLAAGIFTSLGVVVDPAVGAIFMSLSTVLVAINSQTLRRHEK